MIDFNFVSPTKIFFGKDKENSIGEICEEFNFKNVLIVIGQGSVKKSGLLDRVISKLEDKKIKFSLFSGVRANPEISLCREGISLAKKEKVDSIIGIGGGSVIDTCKNISVGYYYDGDSFDFNLHKIAPKKALPIGVILTISAAGSELSNSCVIQDDNLKIKMGFNADIVRPVFAIENPELTYSVDKYQTAIGIVDIMMHTLERYIQASNGIEIADGFAETLLANIVKAAYKVMKDPCDYEGRSILMLASSLSHNGITSIGKQMGLPLHQLEHALSGAYPFVAHGAGLAALYPAFAKVYLPYETKKFARLARAVFGVKEDDDLKAAEAYIIEIEKFFNFLNVPQTYKELGIENVDIELLVNLTSNNHTRVVNIPSHPLDYVTMEQIFRLVK